MPLKTTLGLLLSLLIIASPIGVNPAKADSQQLFTSLADAKEYQQQLRHFIPFTLISGINNGALTTQEVKGKLTRLSYKIPPSYEPSHVVNNYKQQVIKLGGSLLFECELDSCGNSKAIIRKLEPLNDNPKDAPALFSAELNLANKQLYISAFATKWERQTSLQLDIIEVIPEPLDLIGINQDYLGAQIVQKEFADRSEKDLKGAKDHPMIARLPGAFIFHYQEFQFGETQVFTSVNQGQHQIESLAGKITDINYQLPREYSEFEVDANYHAALSKLGFTQRFQCQGTACGKQRHIADRIEALAKLGLDENQYYGLYSLNRPEGKVHVMTYTLGFGGGLWSEIRIIEETALIDDRLVIDLDGLTDKLAQTGHVALDGLLFKFDSDEMLAEAKPVIDIVAGYLQAHPQQQFYVIGHTDDQGLQTYNQGLSEKRAKAVVHSLTQEHQIPVSQLTAQGVGEYSPVANNSHEAGQKLNRRVELVLRSDNK
jgi:flagellar motor protein MotB